MSTWDMIWPWFMICCAIKTMGFTLHSGMWSWGNPTANIVDVISLVLWNTWCMTSETLKIQAYEVWVFLDLPWFVKDPMKSYGYCAPCLIYHALRWREMRFTHRTSTASNVEYWWSEVVLLQICEEKKIHSELGTVNQIPWCPLGWKLTTSGPFPLRSLTVRGKGDRPPPSSEWMGQAGTLDAWDGSKCKIQTPDSRLVVIYEGFLKCWYPEWMVYNGKSH